MDFPRVIFKEVRVFKESRVATRKQFFTADLGIADIPP